jgi:hypothetical protein
MLDPDNPLFTQLIGIFVAMDTAVPGILEEVRQLTHEVEASRPTLWLVGGTDLDRRDLN